MRGKLAAIAWIVGFAGAPGLAHAQSEPRGVCVDPRGCGPSQPAPSQVQPQAPPPADPNTSFVIQQAEARGEAYILTADGRILSGGDMVRTAIDNRARIITGPSGHVRLSLPDGTSFTVAANSEILIDAFVYDPSNNVRSFTVSTVKGFFRWITGNLQQRFYNPTFGLPVGNIGIRGTDFEVEVFPGGSGRVTLHSGELSFTEYDTGRVEIVTPPRTLNFADFKVVR